MHWWRGAILAVLLAAGCRPVTPAHLPAGGSVKHVLVISVDGLRPDLLMLADVPHIRGLCRSGSYTFWATTTEVAVTLPSHVSMMTGVVPDRHGVWWNYELYSDYMRYPAVPTLFELAKHAGLTTAMAAAKSKFNTLSKPGTVDGLYLPDGYANSEEVAKQAARLIDAHRPDVMLVHFADVDAAGHGGGWGSAGQLDALAGVDRAIGSVMAALRRRGMLGSTAIILTADHGGAGWGHGRGELTSRTIPWIISGPGIRRGYDLTRESYLRVRVEDTFATACHLLNLPLDADLDGKPVTQALESFERERPGYQALPWKQGDWEEEPEGGQGMEEEEQ